ncbi:hypothetical protein ASF99_13055 [Exiguobacterium sp. Leaf187]|uniref:diguanylate cyclase domain-containing protein n=1 Tax=Exiguobacterium TaxID=33986 RepID=UPI0006F7FA0A|nr:MULTISPECIES: diguanylate cyclase [Exiguobacterium]KQS15363.1 hypothetical protein ASF99_13055 [Exiguobacterium sp. Leaf187]
MFNRINLRYFILVLYLLGYYCWILLYPNSPYQSIGSSICSIIGLLIALYFLILTLLKTINKERTFWSIITLGTFFYLAAEILWMISDTMFGKEVIFISWSDVFYLLQIICILSALFYKIMHQTKMIMHLSFMFDFLIILIIATTFSWYLLISPVLASSAATPLAFIISLAYPIGDLGMLIAAVFLMMHRSSRTHTSSMIVIILAVCIQAIADSAYLYLISIDNISSGSVVDPLFILSIILLSFAGRTKTSKFVIKHSSIQLEKLNIFQVLIPYSGILFLFTFMVFHSNSFDIISAGCGISICLVLIRQIVIVLENQKLVDKYIHQANALEVSEERYKSLFEYHPHPVCSMDLEGNFESVNEACSQLFNLSSDELVGQNSLAFIEKKSKTIVLQELEFVFKGSPRSYEVKILNSEGGIICMNLTNIPIIVQNEIVGIFAIGKDVTEEKTIEQQVKYLAYHDQLTGLSNRSAFENHLTSLIEGTFKQSDFKLALFFIDLNDFKHVNDTLGHDIGDLLLQAVGGRLKSIEKQFEMIARQGGDEFTLLLKNVLTQEQLKQRAELILSVLKAPYYINGQTILCPPSIGISSSLTDATTAMEIMKQADIAMYQAKKNRLGAYVLYSDLHLTSKQK